MARKHETFFDKEEEKFVWETDKQSHSREIGTRAYTAPELTIKEKYDNSVDIHSLGVVLLELHTSFRTEKQLTETLEKLRNQSFQSPENVTVESHIGEKFVSFFLNECCLRTKFIIKLFSISTTYYVI